MGMYRVSKKESSSIPVILAIVSENKSESGSLVGAIRTVARFNKNNHKRLKKAVIQRLLREDMMKESVIYQDILAKGEVKGKAEGIQEGEAKLILRQLNRRVGQIAPALSQQIQGLSVEQLETLGEALLDFTSEADLRTWLSEPRN